MQVLIEWLLFVAASMAGTGSPIGKCDPIDGPRLEWTKSQRQQAREMATDHLRAAGASAVFLAFVDAATIRESSGAASRWHDGGSGLGPHGLNVRYHGKGRNLCDPRQSAEAVRDLIARCIRRHRVSNIWEAQACYAGRFECIADAPGDCTAAMQDRTTDAICGRMAARGFDCYASIGTKDLGYGESTQTYR